MSESSNTHFEVLIVGGGTGGICVAARLANQTPAPSIGIIEPAETHYYQPIWTLVGGGVVPKEPSARPMADQIPSGATWIKDRAATFAPEQNTVVLASGQKLSYDQLVLAPGIQLDWDKIDGLKEHVGTHGICSNYSYDTVDSTWASIQAFTGGNALFTFPNTPIKCAGAPQKIMYLAEESFRQQGVRNRSKVIYSAPGAGIFGIPKYKAALEKIIAARDIDTMFRTHLVALQPEAKKAVFEHLDTGKKSTVDYGMIHVTPPQSAPDFIKKSPFANADGWVDVDKHTTQHVRYPNVFSLGDASSLPCSKTGAAIRKQAPVLVENLMAQRNKRPLTGHYNGYASCPLVTSRGTVMLAEFGYDGVIMETFPFDQAQERYSMYALKLYGLPQMYWHGMLKGRM